MNIEFRIYNREEMREVTHDHKHLAEAVGFDTRLKIEDIALQTDGQVIVCDSCGRFGYLDMNIYELQIAIGEY